MSRYMNPPPWDRVDGSEADELMWYLGPAPEPAMIPCEAPVVPAPTLMSFEFPQGQSLPDPPPPVFVHQPIAGPEQHSHYSWVNVPPTRPAGQVLPQAQLVDHGRAPWIGPGLSHIQPVQYHAAAPITQTGYPVLREAVGNLPSSRSLVEIPFSGAQEAIAKATPSVNNGQRITDCGKEATTRQCNGFGYTRHAAKDGPSAIRLPSLPDQPAGASNHLAGTPRVSTSAISSKIPIPQTEEDRARFPFISRIQAPRRTGHGSAPPKQKDFAESELAKNVLARLERLEEATYTPSTTISAPVGVAQPQRTKEASSADARGKQSIRAPNEGEKSWVSEPHPGMKEMMHRLVLQFDLSEIGFCGEFQSRGLSNGIYVVTKDVRFGHLALGRLMILEQEDWPWGIPTHLSERLFDIFQGVSNVVRMELDWCDKLEPYWSEYNRFNVQSGRKARTAARKAESKEAAVQGDAKQPAKWTPEMDTKAGGGSRAETRAVELESSAAEDSESDPDLEI